MFVDFRLANDAAAARESSEKQSFRLRDELDRYQNLPKYYNSSRQLQSKSIRWPHSYQKWQVLPS